jgi:hypothetical protein
MAMLSKPVAALGVSREQNEEEHATHKEEEVQHDDSQRSKTRS